MAVNLVSPGVNIREIDLTKGGIAGGSLNIGGIVGPFEKGPVNEPTLIQTEQQLIDIFGKPKIEDDQYEYWMSASNYLSYGGSLNVVRCGSASTALKNANVATGGSAIDLRIESDEDYQNNHFNDSTWIFASRNPGSWANDLKVCVIDNAADQIISGINTSSIQVGFAATQAISNQQLAIGSTVITFNGYLRGIVTGIGNSQVSVKITDRVSIDGNSTDINYSSGITTSAFAFISSKSLQIRSQSSLINTISANSYTALDWYDNQKLDLKNSTIYWRSVAQKPGTSQYATERNAKNDEIHVVVVDDSGTITGTPTVLERYLSLSKATDGKISPSQPIYYKDFISQNSNYIFHGSLEADVSGSINKTTGVASGTGGGTWGSLAQSKSFNVIGNKTYTLTGGKDYSGTNDVGGYSVDNSDIISGYELFKNSSEFSINYLIGGPSGGPTIYHAQAKANALIAIAEERKDCVATISPYKASVVNVSNSNTQTKNIIEFFEPLSSSSYAVFDSGYKYTLDRFNNRFVYVPCNSDIAGIMARTAVNNFAWFSPAGTTRGSLLNVVKLAYNPSQAQRDELYTKRINPIISTSGSGVILFGDKTALGYVSAFDRINVRMLFITIQRAIESAARDQLFEFNDAITRSNFVNIVEPYLRDVRAKRGITEFLVICDETNNTPDIIDANEFKADIFVKPARSINFVGLTFVATRTGISFSEVVGTV